VIFKKSIFVTLLFLNLFHSVAAHAAVRSQADMSNLKRSYDANQWHIQRFTSEYQSIEKQFESEPMDYDVKKRMQNLKTQIELLTNENKKILNSMENSKVKSGEKTPGVLSAEDWNNLSMREKEDYLFSAFGKLEQQGVFLMKSPHDYVEELDLAVQDPFYKEAVMDNLLMLKIYEKESQTRPVIQKLWLESRQV